ncbi:class I SAM-dependent methyltransferase [Streptomyces sp. NPDC051098]|uniref:SAM-dependent methyltransferase n=1 Tax=Streptomyces sp. NPDC051098 TaxID=3155411 RepID=UPI003412D832
MRRRSRRTYKGTSPEAIVRQYDYLGTFYRLALGPDLVFSYAMWHDDDTLESAQVRKLDYHVDAARAGGAQRVLDVGCGWGSLLRRLVEAHQVEHAVGVTMSPGQAAWIREQRWPGCEARAENWYDHQPDAPYDAIIAIEAIEHFAGSTLFKARRVARYREFFERCHAWLRPGGRLSLQANTWHDRGWVAAMLLPSEALAGPSDQLGGRSGKHVAEAASGGLRNLREGLHASRKVFPEMFLPTRAEIVQASRGTFGLIDERRDPDDGARTIHAWLERLEANRDRGSRLVGANAVSDLIREQRTALRFQQERRIGVIRMTFERR